MSVRDRDIHISRDLTAWWLWLFVVAAGLKSASAAGQSDSLRLQLEAAIKDKTRAQDAVHQSQLQVDDLTRQLDVLRQMHVHKGGSQRGGAQQSARAHAQPTAADPKSAGACAQ